MPVAVKISLLFSGLFLLSGMVTGVWKYRKIMTSPDHTAPVYVDIAHRTSFFYCFASLVISRLIEFSPFSTAWQVLIVAVPVSYFVLTVVGYVKEGYVNKTENMFAERNFITTLFMYGLILGEISGVLLIVGGFMYTQFFI